MPDGLSLARIFRVQPDDPGILTFRKQWLGITLDSVPACQIIPAIVIEASGLTT